MAFKLSLNSKILRFREMDLPCLVHYKDKTGGSQFSVTLIANLFLQGSKILFLTAYPMAKDNFADQTKGLESKVRYVENQEDLQGAEDYQALVLQSGDSELFYEAINHLGDINERILFVKNIEFFDEPIIKKTLTFNKTILSGNIDECVAKNQIIGKQFKTLIAFSKSKADIPINIPILEKYSGYLKSEHQEGIVKVNMQA